MTNTPPQPITLDANTLNEDFVQETMSWLSSKTTEDLKRILTEETNQPETYAPEIIEAAQRILATRHELNYTSTLGKYFPHFFGQEVEAKLPGGGIHNFTSHNELRNAILEGRIPKDTFVRPIGQKPEKSFTKEAHSESEWTPLQIYNNFSALYTPILFSIKWGVFWVYILRSE